MTQSPGDIFQLVRAGQPLPPQVEEQFPFYALDAPGLPVPGQNFTAHAVQMGDAPPVLSAGSKSSQRVVSWGGNLEYLLRRALYDEEFTLPVQSKSGIKVVRLVPGHLFGDDTTGMNGGPRPAKVMILGKHPGRDEVEARRNFVGPAFQILFDAFDELGVGDERFSFYVDNLVHWSQVDAQSDSLPTAYKKDCDLLLQQTLRLVRPDFLLCLGSDASKWVLGTEYGVNSMIGRVQNLTIPITERGEDARYHTIKVMAATHPAAVHRTPELYPEFKDQLGVFISLINGTDVGQRETDIDHRNVYKHRELKRIVDEILADPDPQRRIISVDGEWEGEHPTNPGAYLRTLQFSTKHGEGICVVLRHQGGSPAFQPSIAHAKQELTRLLKARPGYNPRVGGHFLRADLPWLIHEGLDVRDEYAPAATPELCRDHGGWDTGLAYHAYNETASFRLKDMAVRLTKAPVYDTILKNHITDYCNRHSIKKDDLEGYGFLPDWILHPEKRDPERGQNYACLHGESLVKIEDGSWVQIKKLVRDQYAGRVISLVNGKPVACRVTGWHRHDVNQKEWRQLVTATAAHGRWGLLGPTFTPDHEVITQRGKVRVDQLQCGQDAIATDEEQPSASQLSLILGTLLGDGGYQCRNGVGVGIGFSQCERRREYVMWKAASLSKFCPALRDPDTRDGFYRFETPFLRVFSAIRDQFPAHEPEDHGKCKLLITPRVLDRLGDFGLAVWYQDDGSIAWNNPGQPVATSRIYCVLSPDEQRLVVNWLTRKFGDGVEYKDGNGTGTNRFIRFKGDAHHRFHAAINPYMHPQLAYKTTLPVATVPQVDQEGDVYYEPVLAVVPRVFSVLRRGNGVRYCLTVETAGNFLTKAGFVSNCYDPDVTRRIIMRHFATGGLLDSDWHGNSSWEPFWRSHRASLGVLEMEMTGIMLDRQRVDQLTPLYMDTKQRLLDSFRQAINWPTFNPESAPQCVAFLFGDNYSQKRDKVTGHRVAIRPPDAMTLGLFPVKTTGKRSKLWDDVVARNETNAYSPSTDKEVLGILGHAHPLAMQLRDLKFITQVLKGPLRPPRVEEDGMSWTQDDDGHLQYDKGLASTAMGDGRVHTHISQCKETGRFASARPPLQNISSRREADYARIMGTWRTDKATGQRKAHGDYMHIFPTPMYLSPIRTIFCASPGCVLVEADYTGAELAVVAWLANDANMIEHVRRNTLPEGDPDHYDIHSHTAVDTFRLPCRPTKAGLKEAGLISLRVAAKNVNFGQHFNVAFLVA